MMLQELAEKMKQEEQPEPVAQLRRMRAFVNAHPYDEMNQRYAEAAEAEKNIRTAADRYEWLKNMAAINRDATLLNLYRNCLRLAEQEERKEAGGGAAFYEKYRGGIERIEQEAREKCEKLYGYQLTLDAIGV